VNRRTYGCKGAIEIAEFHTGVTMFRFKKCFHNKNCALVMNRKTHKIPPRRNRQMEKEKGEMNTARIVSTAINLRKIEREERENKVVQEIPPSQLPKMTQVVHHANMFRTKNTVDSCMKYVKFFLTSEDDPSVRIPVSLGLPMKISHVEKENKRILPKINSILPNCF
jgi:hypothetical protein